DSDGCAKFSRSELHPRSTKQGRVYSTMDSVRSSAPMRDESPRECRQQHFEKIEAPFSRATEYSHVTPDNRADNRRACQCLHGFSGSMAWLLPGRLFRGAEGPC